MGLELVLTLDMAHIICATKPSALMMSNNGVLIAAQIWGPTPLPWPIPAASAVQLSWPCNILESL